MVAHAGQSNRTKCTKCTVWGEEEAIGELVTAPDVPSPRTHRPLNCCVPHLASAFSPGFPPAFPPPICNPRLPGAPLAAEFLFSALGQNFFDLCTGKVIPSFALPTCGHFSKSSHLEVGG